MPRFTFSVPVSFECQISVDADTEEAALEALADPDCWVNDPLSELEDGVDCDAIIDEALLLSVE